MSDLSSLPPVSSSDFFPFFLPISLHSLPYGILYCQRFFHLNQQKAGRAGPSWSPKQEV